MEYRVVDAARKDVGLSVGQLWLRFFSLGGMATEEDVGSYLLGTMTLEDSQYEVLAHAVNECCFELGRERLVPYRKP